jgi:hypothetical protein
MTGKYDADLERLSNTMDREERPCKNTNSAGQFVGIGSTETIPRREPLVVGTKNDFARGGFAVLCCCSRVFAPGTGSAATPPGQGGGGGYRDMHVGRPPKTHASQEWARPHMPGGQKSGRIGHQTKVLFGSSSEWAAQSGG